MDTKVRLLMVLIWPVNTYRCKSWTVKITDEPCREALKMKVLLQILHILWLARKPTSE